MILWRGKEVRCSTSAYHELSKYNLSQVDILNLLENGKETEKSRKEGIKEICLTKTEGLYKVVICESFDYSNKQNVFVITHIGLIRSPKRRR